MRVELQVDGGFAYVPALSEPIVVDSADLTLEASEVFERKVRETDFFTLPEILNTPPKGAADIQHYTITVEDGERSHTVRANDPIPDPRLQDLIRYLQQQRSLR